MKRSQENAEKIEAILNILESDGTLTPELRTGIENITEPGQGRELSKAHRNNNPIPEWAQKRTPNG